MAKKTYRTFSLKSLFLMLRDEEGNSVEVKFYGGIQIDSTAKFTTKSPKLQELLEKCSGFGRDYYLESVVDDAPAAPAPAEEKKAEPAKAPEKEVMTEMKDSRRFKNLVEMRNAMKELGIEIADDAPYAKAKAVAAKEGYDFQIQKK